MPQHSKNPAISVVVKATVNSGQWTVDSEQLSVNSEQWTVDNGHNLITDN